MMDANVIEPWAMRAPTEPYVGLRPFLDHESILLFGRERQVSEVVERLSGSRFVTVLGGSGSGKSSLIIGGVVPALRSFGMPGAGDFWIPIVFTPGTLGEVGVAPERPTGATPIQRLAQRFAQQLTPLDVDEENALRIAEIATTIRQESGFTRLIEGFGDELAVGPGPDVRDARLLLVIDQFEELFHPNNRGAEDARLLVERVIEHFFAPHPRCFVVLTLRSEHVSDCAAYLELPDAINASSYLVRRLDQRELREAIVGPAQRWLRLLQRRGARDALPAAVAFEERVVERLLRDVSAIKHDPDHLPLMQHLLARLWGAACAREGVTGGVPSMVTWSDLQQAVTASPAPTESDLPDGVNALRDSLENWAEATYRRHAEPQHAIIDSLLRRLAFKDPNTGAYTQQRVDVDDPQLFGGAPDARGRLRDILEEGFIGSVDYLFWDASSPQHMTIKVSHESFVRGWSRFRRLVDSEAGRLEEFVTVLRRCTAWKGRHCPDESLLEASELMTVQDAGLASVLESPARRQAAFEFLRQFRDGEQLATMEPHIDAFLAASWARRGKTERDSARLRAEIDRAKANRKRNFWFLAAAAVFALIAIPYAAFSIFIQAPVLHSIENFAAARSLVERRVRSDTNTVTGAPIRELHVLLLAATLVERARAGIAIFDRPWMRGVVDGLPPVGDAQRLAAMSTSEPMVNGSLRGLLTTALWSSYTDPFKIKHDLPVRVELACPVAGANGEIKLMLGSLFGDPVDGHGMFVPATSYENSDISFYAARYVGGNCEVGRVFWSVPRSLVPFVLVDARLRYLAVALSRPPVGQPSMSLYAINWDADEPGSFPRAQVKFRSAVTDDTAVTLVRMEIDATEKVGLNVPEVKGVVSWREAGGIGVWVAGQSWRLFTEAAQRIDAAGAVGDWVQLAPAAAGSSCASLSHELNGSVPPGFASTMYQDGNRCFAIQHGNPIGPLAAQSDTSPEQQHEQVMVAIYEQPRAADLSSPGAPLPTPIASLVAFDDLMPSPLIQGDWVIGNGGELDGWIALRRRTGEGHEEFIGAPWSTSALRRLGQQVDTPPQQGPASSPSLR